MFLCSGPPRSYSLPTGAATRADGAQDTADAGTRLEDVALATHASQRVLARVTAADVSLWTTTRALPGTTQRLLARCARGGRWLQSQSNEMETRDDTQALAGLAPDCAGNRQLWAVWTAGEYLAVVERGAQSVEFYGFQGLTTLLQMAAAPHTHAHENGDDDAMPDQPTFSAPRDSKDAGDADANGAMARKAVAMRASFVADYALNQGESARDRADVAASLSGVSGSPYVFVGMRSGMISVLELTLTADSPGSGLRIGANAIKMWQIDVLAHLEAAADTESDGTSRRETSPPSCYDLTCASSESPAHITALYLVANFEGGKCFIMLLTPAAKRIDQLLSLVNTQRDSDATCVGRCTVAALDASGSRLALGWADGGVSLFRLALESAATSAAGKTRSLAARKETEKEATLMLEPLRELSLSAWGYGAVDTGGVTALAWSHDACALGVGYELRGFSLFSADGCRLMSSLPQHNQPRPEDVETTLKEGCAFGVLALCWTQESTALVVVPRGQQSVHLVPLPQEQIRQEVTLESETLAPPTDVSELYEMVEASMLKKEDGLCLSLSGAPGRCGAWVRSDKTFTRRSTDGGMGPAEACGQIEGGDLLVGINDNTDVVNLPFEQIVRLIKQLPDHETVTLRLLRLKWERVFPLVAQALGSRAFLDAHGIQLLEDESLCVREYALRMQVLHGDCDLEERPPLLEFERRAKFNGWEAIQGTSTRVATHKYVKLLFALFPVWNPHHFLNAVAEYDSAVRSQQQFVDTQQKLKALQAHRDRVFMRRPVSVAFTELDFAKMPPPSGGGASKLVLLEHSSVRLVAAPSLDDPCALTSCVNWSVPAEFEKKCCPLRLVALSASGNQLAVAGQRGFCLLNIATGKWRMFGNVNDEQDMFVYSLMWASDDVLLVNFTRYSEQHQSLHLQAYPRNHLDEESLLERLVFARGGENAAHSRDDKAGATGLNVGDDADDCFFIMERDDAASQLFCLSRCELWCFNLELSGSIKQDDLHVTIQLKRQVNLPSRVTQTKPVGACRRHNVLDLAVLPRFLHIQDERFRAEQQQKYQAEREREHEDDGWLSSFVNMLVGGEVPDQYTPEEVLPRFAFLDSAGDVVVWDPENRSQRVLCSNVSTMARLFVSPQACASWPAPCRLIYGLYGPEGMKVWLPLLDGVYMAHSKAFELDERRLETFLACHDPLRAKTYEIEFGTAPATVELYEQVVGEYGVALEGFLTRGSGNSPPGSQRKALEDGPSNLRGCVTSVDDSAAKDGMLRFDSDVKVLGVEQTFGLLVGVSQDVYVPSGVQLPCYDVFARVQPIFHTLLCFLVKNNQLKWARLVLQGVRKQFALATPTQELFLHSMLEACFTQQCSQEKLLSAIQLLRPVGSGEETVEDQQQQRLESDGDIAEYCEIVANVARKSEPSRLKMLFPAAGDPMDLLLTCQKRSELRTAANFLLILEECSTASTSSSSLRKESAAKLIRECVDQEEWVLAQHVVRVARDWEHPSFDDSSYSAPPSEPEQRGSSIDEQLAALVWTDLMRGEFERVAWCVEDLQAKLPRKSVYELERADSEAESDEDAVRQRLHEVFIQGNKRRQLRVLLQAVTEAHYDPWIERIKFVMEQ